MKLSTKTRYGVRLMLELALNYRKGYMQLAEMARKQDISGKYSEQIISQLKLAGLVQSQRGAHGGYILARKPSAIHLNEIVEKLEGTLSFLDCLDKGVCEKNGRCPAQNVWRKLAEAMAGTLNKITLENMVEDQKGMHTLPIFDI